jgi:hypothetical protein
MDPCRWRSLVLDSNNILASMFHWQNSTQKEIVGIYSRICLVDSMKSKCRDEYTSLFYASNIISSLLHLYYPKVKFVRLFGT